MKIRIAVAVDEHGRWQSGGIEGTSDDVKGKWAMERLLHGLPNIHAHVVFVEADVPLPTSVTVKGEVVE